MGEIADALRKANEQRLAELDESSSNAEIPRVPLPPPIQRHRSTSETYPEPSRYEEPTAEEPPKVQTVVLTHDGPAALAPQAVVIDRGGGIAETCQQLAVRVAHAMGRAQARGVAVVSAVRDEGKTVVASNLALALASINRDREVAFVDLDLRRPSVATVLELTPGEYDIGQMLADDLDLSGACTALSAPRLDVYPAFRACHNAQELLVGTAFARVVADLERRYRYVVYDTPPSLLVPDANLILAEVQSFVTVARAGTTRVRAFQQMIDQLPEESYLGAILNEAALPRHAREYGAYYQADAAPGDET